MKGKIDISICIFLMLNDHSNPYIESTTVLSDNYIRISYEWLHGLKPTKSSCQY